VIKYSTPFGFSAIRNPFSHNLYHTLNCTMADGCLDQKTQLACCQLICLHASQGRSHFPNSSIFASISLYSQWFTHWLSEFPVFQSDKSISYISLFPGCLPTSNLLSPHSASSLADSLLFLSFFPLISITSAFWPVSIAILWIVVFYFSILIFHSIFYFLFTILIVILIYTAPFVIKSSFLFSILNSILNWNSSSV